MSILDFTFLSSILHEAEDDKPDVKIGDVKDNNDNTGNEGEENTSPEDNNEDIDDDDYILDDDNGEDDSEPGTDEDDYNLPDDDDNNDTPDDNNEGDAEPTTDEDDYSLDGDDEGGDDNPDKGGEEPTDDNPDDNSDDSSEGDEGTSLSDQIADIEDKIYQDLTDDEKISRVMELKGKCSKVYTNCIEIIEQLSNVPKTTLNQEVIEELIKDLINLKTYTVDYISNVFDSKSYSENRVWYDKTEAIMAGVKNVLEELTKPKYMSQYTLSDTHTEAVKESKLSSSQRDKLKDSDFGLPKERKFPIHDRAHVQQAIRFFGDCPANKKPELAKRIKKAASEFGVEIDSKSIINKY